MDKGSASLNFLALGLGFIAGLHISRYAIDGVRSTGRCPPFGPGRPSAAMLLLSLLTRGGAVLALLLADVRLLPAQE